MDNVYTICFKKAFKRQKYFTWQHETMSMKLGYDELGFSQSNF